MTDHPEQVDARAIIEWARRREAYFMRRQKPDIAQAYRDLAREIEKRAGVRSP